MEHELLELWSSVEKDKDARRELAAATHVARQMRRTGKGRHHKQARFTHLSLDPCHAVPFRRHMQLGRALPAARATPQETQGRLSEVKGAV